VQALYEDMITLIRIPWLWWWYLDLKATLSVQSNWCTSQIMVLEHFEITYNISLGGGGGQSKFVIAIVVFSLYASIIVIQIHKNPAALCTDSQIPHEDFFSVKMDLRKWVPWRHEGKDSREEYVSHWVCGVAKLRTAAHRVVPLFICESNEVPHASTVNTR
jgi:hypothetical protein